MIEYVKIRASETLDQHELVDFLKFRFENVKRIGKAVVQGTECVEVSVRSDSDEFQEIRRFVDARRGRGARNLLELPIGTFLRKYTDVELREAEILTLRITSHVEPPGEECGTVYETLCDQCNLGKQVSELVLDLHNRSRLRDISETIARVEWIASSALHAAFKRGKMTGAEFRRIVDFTNPTTQVDDRFQLWINGSAGKLSDRTQLGKDAFSPGEVRWRCPFGHSTVTEFLSETYIQRSKWDGSDISVTCDRFGQGMNLLRPSPRIIISQRMYRLLKDNCFTGYSVEVAHLT